MEIPKIEVKRDQLGQLLTDMRSGRLQVPRFQREFAWPLSKTRELLDSMYKEFPIGTIFLWRAPMEHAAMFRSLEDMGIPEPSSGQQVSYILDGQQRLSSLFAVIFGIKVGNSDYGRVCIDLDAATRYDDSSEEGFEEQIFVHRKPDDQQFIAVQDLLGDRNLEIYDEIPKVWKPTFQRARRLMETYPFSVVWVQEQSLADAITIFQRINQGGKRLSRYDLVCANLWTEDFDFRKRVAAVNEKLNDESFGALHETIYTQSFALILEDKCTTAAELSLETDKVRESWEQVMRALNLAVDFAATNLGVRRAEYLPYRGIIPVLAHFFYHSSSPSLPASHREMLWQWFWRVTLSERYGSTSPLRMAEDALKLQLALNSKPAVFDYPSRVTPETVAKVKMTQTTSALRNAVLCMLALKSPRNFKDGSPINLWDPYFSDLKKAERHHVFPIGYLKPRGHFDRIHIVPNFCFIPADLNREISSKPPSEYLIEYKSMNSNLETALQSHLLPSGEDSPLWEDDFDRFIDARSKLLSDELNRLLAKIPQPPSRPVVGMPKTDMVDVVEVRLRDFIDERLTAVLGDAYWKSSVPGDVIGTVKSRVEEELGRHPYMSRSEFASPRQRLDFCHVGDYEKILLVNWEVFGEVFGSKRQLEKHLDAYRRLRNSVQHNRTPTDIEQQEGEIAIKWLERTLDKYESQKAEAFHDYEES